MVRTPCCDNNGMKKGTWTPEEDRKLIAYVTRYGSWNWRQLPKFAGLRRCGKSCRLRWMNYLRPDIKRGNYTKEEEETIIGMHKLLGNRWSTIAAKLPGRRTDNDVKNYWHTKLKKRVAQGPNTTVNDSEAISSNPISQITTIQNKESEAYGVNLVNPAGIISTIENPLALSPQASLSNFSPEISNNLTAKSTEDLLADNCLDFVEAYDVPVYGDFWSDLFLGDDYPLNNDGEPLVEGEMLFSFSFQDHHYGSLN